MSKRIIQGVVALSLAVAALAASPAMADSVSCFNTKPWGQATCETGDLFANSKYHFVHLSASSKASYQVYDRRNGVMVAGGNAGWGGAERTIYGLYSYYYMKLQAPLVVDGSLQNH